MLKIIENNTTQLNTQLNVIEDKNIILKKIFNLLNFLEIKNDNIGKYFNKNISKYFNDESIFIKMNNNHIMISYGNYRELNFDLKNMFFIETIKYLFPIEETCYELNIYFLNILYDDIKKVAITKIIVDEQKAKQDSEQKRLNDLVEDIATKDLPK